MKILKPELLKGIGVLIFFNIFSILTFSHGVDEVYRLIGLFVTNVGLPIGFISMYVKVWRPQIQVAFEKCELDEENEKRLIKYAALRNKFIKS
ncbi:hypothetical protein [Bacillus glycinifermentans]|uniref:hypothetical protein n=1 Tax=Bacillus glycinifermentans TaxID=1664069 RepID=UPI000814CB9C|nr:hypothetical protein [Bacillus glycinifermentans]SCA85849.1 putative membrane protein [Bacillus glycinifermentans]